MPRSPLRLRTAVLAAAPTAATGLLAAFVAPQAGPAAAVGVGLLGAAAAGAAVWAGLTPLARAAAAADDLAAGKLGPAELPPLDGELSSFTAAVRAIEEKRADLAARYDADLTVLAASLSVLADPKATAATLPPLVAPTGEAADRVRAAFDSVAKDLGAARQRVSWLFKILSAVPDAVVVADGGGNPRFLNPSAERLFGMSSAAASGKPLTALFADAGTVPPMGNDPPAPVAGPAELTAWLRAGGGGTLTVRSSSGKLIELTATAPAKPTRDAVLCLVARDASAAWDRAATDRAAVRGNATRRVLDRYLAETTDALAQLGAQFRLLSGDAKQGGSREALVGRLAAARRVMRQLETFHTLARGFAATSWLDPEPAAPSEFTAAEVIARVTDALADRLKARGNTVRVADDGGWLFTDADRLEAALTGLLGHAADAAANAALELRVTRRPPAPNYPAGVTEFHLPDAGPAPPADQLAVVERPFGGLGPAPLGRFDAADGDPLGLVVAARMAASVGGALRLEPTPDGRLSARLAVPTRATTTDSPVTVAAAAPGALDVAPAEETVAGWRLGVPAPQVPA